MNRKLILISLFLPNFARAYIPEYSTLAARAASQHGKGVYQVELEVTFQKEAEAYSIVENWMVQDENNMRVTLEGRGPLKGLVSGVILYQGNNKNTFDGSKNRTQKLGDDWLEPLFYFRSSHYFRSRLVSLNVTPEEAMRDRAPLNADGPPNWVAPSFMRLSRAGGAIALAIGQNQPNAPTLWLEQDQFVVRKFKGTDQSVIKADEYAKFEDGFWFPRSRSYNFGNYSVRISTLRVKSLGKASAADTRFKVVTYNSERTPLRLPEPIGLKEFYSRFR